VFFSLCCQLFPRHKQRIEAYVASFDGTFHARNPDLEHSSKVTSSVYSVLFRSLVVLCLQQLRSAGRVRNNQRGEDRMSVNLRDVQSLVTPELALLDVSGACLSPALLKRNGIVQEGMGLRTTFSKLRATKSTPKPEPVVKVTLYTRAMFSLSDGFCLAAVAAPLDGKHELER
jgi:hypothetical protein